MLRVILAPFQAVIYAALLIVFLIAEVLAAMLAYMYLNLYYIETFGYLVGLCRELLNLFAEQLEFFSPELATQAYATLLGELGPKSVLLLFLGLAVGTVIRAMIWSFHKSQEKMRQEPRTERATA